MVYFNCNANTVITGTDEASRAVQHAVDMLKRDIANVFSDSTGESHLIQISYDKSLTEPESYRISFSTHETPVMHISGRDDLGIIYGLLYISREFLGVDPFWFWADILPDKRVSVSIPMETVHSPKLKVRFRGWFVNDEVCLLGWKEAYPPTKEVWLPVFETLLRCGGNMIIPGTDLPKHGIHFELASEMGLWITHHHAEPLGAQMFKRAYPYEAASYAKNKALYEQLWEDAIQNQKDQKVIWGLSFRGQGDQPFWSHDQSYNTPEKRGKLISDVLKKQKTMIEQYVEYPVCCVALYGEISELYKEGHIDLPNGVIRMWADNGYGKMVSRRNGNEDFRVPSMPESDVQAQQGIYYHITFHDLQASNHLTMFPSCPSLIETELKKVLEAGGDDFLLLNAGNIRMHLYTLDIVSEIWNKGEIELDQHLTRFISRLYSSHMEELKSVYEAYFVATIPYGKHKDNKAGEQFYHHPPRKIIGHWLQGKTNTPIESLFWATGKQSIDDQINYFKEKCQQSYQKWLSLKRDCDQLTNKLNQNDRIRFYDLFVLQVELHLSGTKGFIHLCEAFEYYKKADFPKAFVLASQSLWDYQVGYQAMRKSEHGKWHNFYRADWLTNVEWTMQSIITLRKYLRMQGDSPDFFIWYKQYIMPEEEKHIYLENTHRNPLPDDELAKQLQDRFKMRS
ncbi:glycosyl hydrolase 115 family protein [Gracilibacillus suaedae]|uniref:glycosyl hydrolase 115 family protein n=1 Tax=Gracilibacillus suaedae TaxID=2820273 RepID=UPI001ABEA389|nr:glycosyl hydrolase 115 family protein [Gracilibacillus suaedae]